MISISVSDTGVILREQGHADRHFSHDEALVLLERLAAALPEINNAAARVLMDRRAKLRGQLDDVEERLAKLKGGTLPGEADWVGEDLATLKEQLADAEHHLTALAVETRGEPDPVEWRVLSGLRDRLAARIARAEATATTTTDTTDDAPH